MTGMSFLQVVVTLGGFLLLLQLRMLLQESVAASVARCSFEELEKVLVDAGSVSVGLYHLIKMKLVVC